MANHSRTGEAFAAYRRKRKKSKLTSKGAAKRREARAKVQEAKIKAAKEAATS